MTLFSDKILCRKLFSLFPGGIAGCIG